MPSYLTREELGQATNGLLGKRIVRGRIEYELDGRFCGILGKGDLITLERSLLFARGSVQLDNPPKAGIAERLAATAGRTIEWLLTLSEPDAKERLARVLSLLRDGDNVVEITQTELASICSVTRPWVSNVIEEICEKHGIRRETCGAKGVRFTFTRDVEFPHKLRMWTTAQ